MFEYNSKKKATLLFENLQVNKFLTEVLTVYIQLLLKLTYSANFIFEEEEEQEEEESHKKQYFIHSVSPQNDTIIHCSYTSIYLA